MGRIGNAFWVMLPAAAIAVAAHAVPLQSLDGSAGALRATFGELANSREASMLVGPLHLASGESGGALRGTLYAIVDRPSRDVRAALSTPAGWCAVLILDPNVHACQAQSERVDVAFGESQTPVVFSFRPVAATDEYLQVRLAAAEGLMGTKDYAIALEAAGLDASSTIVHLTFSQSLGWASRLAMQAYFNTVGRGKVGFTVTGRDADGRPVYVSDLRGGVERNLMRQYFAILAYLDSLALPREQQADRRVRTWLAHTERYPLQLHEDADYFARKAPDVRRQQSGDHTAAAVTSR